MTLEDAIAKYPDGVGKGDNRPLSLVGPATNLGDAKAAQQFVMTWFDDTVGEGAVNLCGADGPTCEIADMALTVGLADTVTQFATVDSCAYGNVWDCTSVRSVAVPCGYKVHMWTGENFTDEKFTFKPSYTSNGFLRYQTLPKTI